MAAAFACAVPVWRSSSCIIAQPVRSSTAPAPSVGSTARRTSPSFQVRCDSTPPASSDGAARSRLPRTLLETADQARVAAKQAIDDGKNLLEIQFPVTSDKDPDELGRIKAVPLGGDGNYEPPTLAAVARILDGNMDALRIFVAPFELLGRRLRLVFPNEEEAGIAKSRVFGNVSFKVSALSREPAPEDELQIVINPTWNIDEILNSEKLWIKTGKKPMILFNAELEKIKGNIGWPGYPSRAFDERFLSVAEPAYFLRPFFRGALHRVYPGPWRILLLVGPGNGEEGASAEYRCVLEVEERPAFPAVSDVLSRASRGEEVDAESVLAKKSVSTGGLFGRLFGSK